MLMREFSYPELDTHDSKYEVMEDESVLADGMIPDSRIVKLIDELEVFDNSDFEDYAEADDTLRFLGLR